MGSPSRLCSPCTLPAVPPVSSCPEAPPCTPVLLTACRRRSPPWLPLPSRSRSSLPQRGSTPSGSEAPSWLPSPPSSRCGSPSRSTTSAAHPSSTASASKLLTSDMFYILSVKFVKERSQCLFDSVTIKKQTQVKKKKKKKKKKKS